MPRRPGLLPLFVVPRIGAAARGPLLLLFLWHDLLSSQPRFPLEYLGDLGENRHSVNLGVATVQSIPEVDVLQVQGRNDSGKPWRIYLPRVNKLGYAKAWKADFDGNGRMDVLFAHSFPGSGFCASWLQLTMVLFDATGQPMASVLPNSPPLSARSSDDLPVIARDLDADGRAELVLTECSQGAIRISGIYEARDAKLEQVEQREVRRFREIAKRIYGMSQLPSIAPRTAQAGGQQKEMECDDPRCKAWPVFVSNTNNSREIFVANTRAVLRDIH